MPVTVNILISKDGQWLDTLTAENDWSYKVVVEEVKNRLLSISSWRCRDISFCYFDEDGDEVMGHTEVEWNTVKRVGLNAELTVDVFPAVEQHYPRSGSCCPDVSSKSCCKPPERESLCCSTSPPSSPCCSISSKLSDTSIEYDNSPYARPLPDDVDDECQVLPEKTVNPTLPEYKYSGESLRCVALPLGALGGGNIAIAGDGGLRQWQLSNKVSHNGQAPNSFFAIKVDSKAVVLQSNTWYDETGFKPSKYITDDVVPQCSKDLLQLVPGVKTIEITAKYPVVEVDYTKNGEVLVDVHLEAWSPKVPHDSKLSAVPIVVFDFVVTNKSTEEAKVSMLSSLQNIAGWDGLTEIKDQVKFDGYGGNVNSLYTTNSLYGIDMSCRSLPEKHAMNGHVSICAVRETSDSLSTMLQYASVVDLWNYFTGEGLPGQGQAGPSPAGSTWNGAVCNTRTVAAGASSATKTEPPSVSMDARYSFPPPSCANIVQVDKGEDGWLLKVKC